MMEIIAMLIIVFLAVTGVFAFAQHIKNRLYWDKDDCLYLLLPADENSDALEIEIKRAKHLLRTAGAGAQQRVIVLDNGMSDFVREIALKESEDDENILVMQANELQNLR